MNFSEHKEKTFLPYSFTGSICVLSNFALLFIYLKNDVLSWKMFWKKRTSNFIFIYQTNSLYLWLFSLFILQINYSKNILQLQSLISWNWMWKFNCWFRPSFTKFGNFVWWPTIFDFINNLNTFQVLKSNKIDIWNIIRCKPDKIKLKVNNST